MLCLGGYLLSLAYGVTFLLPLLVQQSGMDEGVAGQIIASATITTVLCVVFSGHIADYLDTARSVAVAGLVLAASGIGFAIADGSLPLLVTSGLALGVGWGMFYTLGPILVAAIIEPARRTHFFALLSGSMMTGIGTGPILGRIVVAFGLPLEATFVIAAVASVAGAAIYGVLHVVFVRQDTTLSGNRISWRATAEVLSSSAILPIVMVGLGACLFGGISSFQTSYAAARGYDYSLFFVGFIGAAITCRLFLSGMVVRREPHATASILTGLMVVSVAMLIALDAGNIGYLASAAVLGVGYGLTYSVINGLAATEAPGGRVPQALLLFSLSYFVGVFGFPLIAGWLIADRGIDAMLSATLVVACANAAIPAVRWLRTSREP